MPGEDSAKVVYRLIDPAQYARQAVLVVGGGDSALEAAIAVAGEEGTDVTLSYRSAAFSRVKQKNRTSLEQLEKSGRIKVMLNSTVNSILPDSVEIKTAQGTISQRNDVVIVCAGGVLPTGFLREIGIDVEVRYGT